MNKSSFLDRVPARGGHPEFRPVSVRFVPHARRLAGLRIDNLHIRNIDPRFLVDDSAAAIAGRLLMPLDDAGTLNLHLAANRRYGQHATALALITAGDQHDLIVFLNLRSLSSFQLSTTSAQSRSVGIALLQMTSGASETIFM